MGKHWDFIIVGQGLAGTTLAWHLKEAGQRVLMVDAAQQVTSSKIAAGLLTPITGRRLSLTWRCDELFPIARAFYHRVEKRTGASVFHERPAVRLFQSDAERRNWSRHRKNAAYEAHLIHPPPDPLIPSEFASAGADGFAMNAAQLDVRRFLDVSREALTVLTAKLDWQRDVSFRDEDVRVLGHHTRYVISCEGFGARDNPYFSWVPFDAAKGEILSVHFERPLPPLTLHRGIWLAPSPDPQIFLAGATYDRAVLDQTPTLAAKQTLEQKLQSLIGLRYMILDHRAAVRPIIHHSRPLAGFHPEHKRLGFLNGLGSKGSLSAPWIAERFAALLVSGEALPEMVDLNQRI